jgi:hypothetical protein
MGRITVTVTGTLPGDPYLYTPDPDTPSMCCVPLILHEVSFDPSEAYAEVSSFARDAYQDGELLREGDTVTFEGQLHVAAANGSPRRRRRSALRRAVMRRLLAR